MKAHHKAIVAVMLAISCLSGVFVFLFYQGSKQSYDRNIEFLATQLEQGFRNKTAAIHRQYKIRLEGLLTTNPEILKAFYEQDRIHLYELTLPKFHLLQK